MQGPVCLRCRDRIEGGQFGGFCRARREGPRWVWQAGGDKTRHGLAPGEVWKVAAEFLVGQMLVGTGVKGGSWLLVASAEGCGC